MGNLVFLLISIAYKDPRKVNSTFGGTEGHYTTHIGTATNDPCTLPGPEGTNYYFKWNHGMPSGGLELPTPEPLLITRDECLESVIVNKLGYYLWVPRNSDQEGKCVSPSGDYVWYYGQLPKEKQTKHYVAPPKPTIRDFVYPENNVTMMSILGLTPPPDEAYTERPEPVTVSPQPEEEQMIIPAPQGPEATEVSVAPIQEAETLIIPAPQATEATVAPIQAPEVVTTAPIQTHPYIPAPSYYPPSYLPPGTMSVPKTVNIFL
ncbi:uncharacterized protein ACN427_008849 isoform 2-T2 [Glossina fuscipes fuscipes]